MKVLFVAMAQSVHTARWVSQLAGQGWDIHLFPIPYLGVVEAHPDLKGITLHDCDFGRPEGADDSVRVVGSPRPRLGARLPGFLKGSKTRAQRLLGVVKHVKPDIIHALEMLECGYLVAQAKALARGSFPKWIVSNWGSELYLLAKDPHFGPRAHEVLDSCDYYTSECHRDVQLARDHGFTKEVLDVIPNAGGVDIARIAAFRQPGKTSDRRTIVVKGYHDWAGRALTAIEAVVKCAPLLAGYRVVVYSASDVVVDAVHAAAEATDIAFELSSRCSHDDMLRLHGSARIYIGLSISDGISTSMLEAMAMGAFPIQSDTSCADEWVRCGESGILVQPEDSSGVAAAIARAVGDDALVDRAAEMNARTVADRLDQSHVRPRSIDIYRRAVGDALVS